MLMCVSKEGTWCTGGGDGGGGGTSGLVEEEDKGEGGRKGGSKTQRASFSISHTDSLTNNRDASPLFLSRSRANGRAGGRTYGQRTGDPYYERAQYFALRPTIEGIASSGRVGIS